MLIPNIVNNVKTVALYETLQISYMLLRRTDVRITVGASITPGPRGVTSDASDQPTELPYIVQRLLYFSIHFA